MGGGAFTCFQSGAQEWDSDAVTQGRGPCNRLRGSIPGVRTLIIVAACVTYQAARPILMEARPEEVQVR